MILKSYEFYSIVKIETEMGDHLAVLLLDCSRLGLV